MRHWGRFRLASFLYIFISAFGLAAATAALWISISHIQLAWNKEALNAVGIP